MLTAPSASLAERHRRVRGALAAHRVEAMVLTHLPNIAYLSNFDGSTAIAVLDARRLYLLTDFRYSAAVLTMLASDTAPPDTEFVRVDGSYEEGLAALLDRLEVAQVGLEAASVSWKRAEWWRQRLQAPLVSGDGERPAAGRCLVATEGVVEGVRMVKDAHEVTVFREAAARLSHVARAILDEQVVRAGRTEHEIAGEVDARMKQAGFSRPAFDTIVASGPNSALPHAHPTARTVETGEVVVLDFGGVLDGYCVDLTRTVAVGEPSSEVRRFYRAVHEAQRLAIAPARPPMPWMRRRETISPATGWPRRSATAPGTGWAWRFTRSRGSASGARKDRPPRCSRTAWSAPSSPACTSRARAGSGSRTMCW